MARIPDTELQRLKQDISLQRLVEAKGIELKKHGADLVGRCPFHDDKTPSLVVSPKKNLWHCLGACQAGGSVIDWVMRTEGISFRHAVELLKGDAPALGTGRVSAAKRSLTPKLAVIERDVDDERLLVQVVDYYHATLKQSPEALAYLEKRGLNSPEMIDHFRLGYANRTLGYRLPGKHRQDGAELRGRLQKLGLLRDSGHEHFTGSLVIPILGEGRQVLGIYGRKIRDDLRQGTAYHLYLSGPHRGVWNLDALKASEDVILCEALIDALTFWCAGYRNVTASYGVEGFTEAHVEAFARHGTKRVLIAYDRDEAGDRAAEKLGEQLMARSIECFRVQFPKGVDANEYALKVTPADKSLGATLRGAMWMGKSAAPQSTDSLASEAATTTSAASKPEPATTRADPPSSSLAAESPARVELAAPPVLASKHDGDKDEVRLVFGDRKWRIRGLTKNTTYEQLRVNVLCARGDKLHVDTFDLYSARHRSSFLGLAKVELDIEEEVLKHDLGRVLLSLEELQDQRIQAALAPKDERPVMTDAESEEALALLCDPRLFDRILADFEKCGVVGEETNKLVSYIAAVSRKLDSPLAVILQSSSAAGKSSLMDAVLAFVPQEQRVKYSAMTGQSLFYMSETNLAHKVLAIVEEAGAERAAYALKLLQSEGELTIASTGKDPTSGKLVTHEYRVEGPVMIFLTTTAVEIDEELLNRCVVLTVDEGPEQTRAIQARQREAETLEGILANEERARLVKLHQNAQRLLQPLLVANPFASTLTFLDDRTRARRDHKKYLTLIRAVALLHQHQRPIRTVEHQGAVVQYIEVTAEDIALANRLAGEVLSPRRDELPPQTRRLLLLIETMVKAACTKQALSPKDYRFSRRELREYTGWSLTQLRLHLSRLAEHEYVLVYRGGRGQSFAYELCWSSDGERGGQQLLADVAMLTAASTSTTGELAGGGGVVSGSWRGAVLDKESSVSGRIQKTWRGGGKSTSGGETNSASYVAAPAE